MENIVQEVSSQPFSVQVHSPQQSPCGHDAGDWIDGHQAISQQFWPLWHVMKQRNWLERRRAFLVCLSDTELTHRRPVPRIIAEATSGAKRINFHNLKHMVASNNCECSTTDAPQLEMSRQMCFALQMLCCECKCPTAPKSDQQQWRQNKRIVVKRTPRQLLRPQLKMN